MWYVIFYFNAGCSKGTMCNYILKNNTAGIYYPLLYTITISWYTMYHFNHTSKTHLQPSLIHLPPHPAVHKHQQYQHQPVEFPDTSVSFFRTVSFATPDSTPETHPPEPKASRLVNFDWWRSVSQALWQNLWAISLAFGLGKGNSFDKGCGIFGWGKKRHGKKRETLSKMTFWGFWCQGEKQVFTNIVVEFSYICKIA